MIRLNGIKYSLWVMLVNTKKKKKKKERQLQKYKPQKYYGSNPVPLDLILLQYCQQLMDLSLRPPLC